MGSCENCDPDRPGRSRIVVYIAGRTLDKAQFFHWDAVIKVDLQQRELMQYGDSDSHSYRSPRGFFRKLA